MLDLPVEVDVVVVGAGLTGVSAARSTARLGRSVLCLDAGAPGQGASSVNGGMVGGGHRLSIDELERRYGHDVAVRLLSEAHLESGAFVRGVIEDEAIECDFVETGRFRGLWRDAEYESAGRALSRLQSLIPVDAEMVPRGRQRDEVATDVYRGGTVYPRHGGLNPAKLAAGLLDAAVRAGAVVQGDTPVTSVAWSGSGLEVTTSRGTVRARDVLVATNGYTPSSLRDHKRRIVPLTSFLVATEELGVQRLMELFPRGRMVVESRDRHCYYRASPDGRRLVFGGRAAMFDAPEALVRRELRRLIQQIFPQLEDVTLTHSWRGRTGFSFDYLPNVGQLDGVWHAMGYSGSGNTMAPWLGHKAALLIAGDPEGETAFTHTDLPTRFWHQGPPWFMPFADVGFRFRDAWNNMRRRS
ncbi:MAG: FAD-binding oxidoreductase [Acidimicrobiales bacterium]|jgi:glycine/D-amino acid oxidase-like deaminating enzyme|nr:FAD-binding oxidoreductase [Acidimicrobiales bacterium]|tara:strand:+ start:482 stop:1720 length:1239 start_codon:yes stop_codon:yes gene_type:complete